MRIARAGLCLLLITVRPAFGQAPDSAHVPASGGRTLGGHTFIPLSAVPLPFPTTHFALSAGAAAAFSVTDPVIVDVGGQVDTIVAAGDLVFAAVDVAYQQRIGTRFAVRVALSGTARYGTNARLLVAEGVSGLSTQAIGGMMVVRRKPNHMLTATLDYRRGFLSEVTPGDFADYVAEWGIDSVQHWADHLWVERKNSRLVGGLRGAWVVKPWLGLSGMFEAGPANLYESGGKIATSFGAGASMDFHALKPGIPVAVGLGVGRVRPPSRADDLFGLATTFNWAVSYSVRPEVAIGVDIQHSRAELVNSSDHISTMSARLALRYDF